MTLEQVVADLANLDDHGVLCARQPWTPSSACVVTMPNYDGGIPSDVQTAGFSYFLEVHVAHGVLAVFGDRVPTPDEQVRLLIFYAVNDAYPDWVYHR